MLLIPATVNYLFRKEMRKRNEALKAWVDSNPELKEMIESGKVSPPPYSTDEKD